MKRTPDYRVGYTLDDNLQVTTEVRAYVTNGQTFWIKDPLGQADTFLLNAKGTTWHHKKYFFKDDNSLIRAIQ